MTTKTKPMRVLITAAICALLATASAHAQTIRIDGDLDDAAWEQAQSISTFQSLDGKTPTAATIGWALTDAENFYLAFRCDEPMMQKLEVASLPRDGAVYNNDCIEVFVAPFENQAMFYHLIVDANGQIYDALNIGGQEDKRYELSITAKTQKSATGWTLEMAVPLCELGLSNTHEALMNFGRERKPIYELSAWHGLFADPKTWQRAPLSLLPRLGFGMRDWSFGEARYGENELTAQFVTGGESVGVLVEAQQNGQWKTLCGQLAPSTSVPLTRVASTYFLLPKVKPQAVRLVIEHNQQPLFRATYMLALPDEALIAKLPVPFYYEDELWGSVQLQSLLSDQSLQSSGIRLLVKAPNGKVASHTDLRPLHKTMNAAFEITGWRNGKGSLTVQLFTGDTLVSSQTIVLCKRSGPFSRIK